MSGLRLAHCFGFFASLLLTTGCNRGPTVHPVKGRVTNQGKGHVKDLAGYGVQLQSVTDSEEKPGGTIEEDGTFILYTRVGNEVTPGVKEGTYRVWLTLPSVEGGPPPTPAIPKRYLSKETANWEYTIKPGENELTLEVQRE
jgi:hypothetical protein